MGIKTKNEIIQILANLLEKGSYSEKEIKLITDYHLGELDLESNEKKELDKLYLKKLEYEKEKIKNQLGDLNRFTILVSLVSFSKNKEEDVMTELPIEKSLRVFEKINKVYLFYTLESEKEFKNIKSLIEEKNQNVTIEGIEIKVDRVEDIYNPLKELILKDLITREKTIFDITLGMKMPGIGIYRLAVERGIISVNWKEVQLPKYKKDKNEYIEESRVERVPLTITLDIMQEPMKASLKNKEIINESLEKEEYQTTAGHYERLGMDDLSFFFNELSEVFSFENMLMANAEIFFEKVGTFLERVFEYKHFEIATLNKIKNFVMLMIALYINGNLKKLEEYSWYKKKNKLKITEDDIDGVICKIEKENDGDYAIYRDEIYYYIILKYYLKKLGRKNFNNSVILTIKREIIKNIEEVEILEEAETLKDIREALFNEKREKLKMIEEMLEMLDIGKEFREKTSSNITYSNGILNIEKYGLEINLNGEKELIHELSYAYSKPLIELLNREDEEKFLSKNELFILLTNIFTYDRNNLEELTEEDYTEKNGYYTKVKSKMKKVVDMFNEIIEQKLQENKRTPKEFFILRKKEDRILEINEEFYKMETI